VNKFFAVASLAVTGAFAADQNLLNLVMPDAKVVFGIQVDQAKASPFGQYMLSQVKPDDPGLQKLMTETGFDPRKNISEVLIASTGPHQPGANGLVLARGSFDPAKVQSAAQAHGGTVTQFSGVAVITGNKDHEGDLHSIAFPDSSTAILGDTASVQGAIGRLHGGGGLTPQLQTAVQNASAGNDLWFVTLAPLSQFAVAVPDPSVNNAMQGSNLFQSVQQASAGVKFGDTVKVNGQAVTNSEKDAQALVDAVRFLLGMVTMNAQKDPAAAMVASLVNALQLQASANTMILSLAVPEKQLEALVQNVHHGAGVHHRPAPAQ